MSVFLSNRTQPVAVLPDSVIRAHRAAQAAIHRDRLARERSEAVAAAKLALITRYQAILAEKAANNGIPPVLAARLADPSITPFERVQVEQTIARIVKLDRAERDRSERR